jgi:hypothetical protein
MSLSEADRSQSARRLYAPGSLRTQGSSIAAQGTRRARPCVLLGAGFGNEPVGLVPPVRMMEECMLEFFDADDLICAYSRSQALEEGVLVDATRVAREAGFRHPVALTRAAWEDCVAWSDADEQRKRSLQDESGRLWDVLQMGVHAIRTQIRRGRGQENRLTFSVFRVPREGDDVQAGMVALELVCGPGDRGEPVMTIQFPGED